MFGGVDLFGSSLKDSSSLEQSEKSTPPEPMPKQTKAASTGKIMPTSKATGGGGGLFEDDADDDIFSFKASTTKKSKLVVNIYIS